MAEHPGDGRFERLSKLGEGGMGSVWLAWDRGLERRVALKEMRTGLLTPQGRPLVSPRRVLREARAASRLRHPNIVQILELIEGADGPLIVMEYVEGPSLAHWIEERPQSLTEVKAAEIARAVADALIVAHAEGVVHRDVKPANILIERPTRKGDPLGPRVRLIDFGNAAIEGYQVTAHSALVGTLGFVAPERFTGRSGPEGDLWSLGVTLYQAVEHRLPFQREQEAEVMYALLNEEPDPPSRARLVAPVIGGLLHKDPDRRLDAPTARDMLTRLLAPPPRPTPHPASARPEPPAAKPIEPIGPAEPAQPTRADLPSSPSAPSGFAAIVAGNPKEAVHLLSQQGPRSAAQVLDRLAAGSDAAVTVVTGMSRAFAAEMLGHARPDTAAAVLRRLAPRVAALLLARVPAGAAPSVLAAMPADDQGTMRIVQALTGGRTAARLLNDLAADQAVALLEPLEPPVVAGVLAGMSPRRAAAVLDRAPSDVSRAAVLIRELPSERTGGILDQMEPRRVAEIMLVVPAHAPRLLTSMSPRQRAKVIDHLNDGPRP
ncbi:protein kinase domain-containing protein [Thermomonospora umbrina]|uniref:non-specific serine/threonine protein kinase n=1 Tax=Thermomonospora umbrina TaxID=111806 RepID=A0A3D9SSD4_9ACTN|nr:protein kinase [Thermomonospora umbrina]REE96883.1 serine/threonine protein kinase [Thermomonospora umbrina]